MRETDAETLRARSLRVTNGRLDVLDALDRAPHADAETLHRLLAASSEGISVQSVHNVLSDLTAAGLVRRFEPAKSSARYERRVDDNHHHAVCSGCGRIDDVECVVGEAPCMHAAAPAGFTVESAEVTFWGLCADCSAARGERRIPTD